MIIGFEEKDPEPTLIQTTMIQIRKNRRETIWEWTTTHKRKERESAGLKIDSETRGPWSEAGLHLHFECADILYDMF